MPKLHENPQAFVPVEDPQSVLSDPVNSRVLALFDALRRRNVGPERAAYVISQVHAQSASSAHSAPNGKQ